MDGPVRAELRVLEGAVERAEAEGGRLSQWQRDRNGHQGWRVDYRRLLILDNGLVWSNLSFRVNGHKVDSLLSYRVSVAEFETFTVNGQKLVVDSRAKHVRYSASQLAHDEVRAFPVFLEFGGAVRDRVVNENHVADRN